MTLETLSTIFIAIISAWAVWCALSGKVRDGILGKLIYAVIAIAGYAIVTRTETLFFTPSVAGVTFHGGLAMAGLRHFFMVTWWQQVKRWLCRKMNCEHCMHQLRRSTDRRPRP